MQQSSKRSVQLLLWQNLTYTDRAQSAFAPGLAMAKGYAASTASERSSDMEYLISTLPVKPLPDPILTPYPSDLAASEKYVCAQLGYTGQIPGHITALIREGISIRFLGPDNKPGEDIVLSPPEPDQKFAEYLDIDTLEVLMHRRMHAMWRALPTRRRGPEPRLCQVGHVMPAQLNEAIARFRREKAEGDSHNAMNARMKGHDFMQYKVWVRLDPSSIGYTSVSQDEPLRKRLLASWDARAPADRKYNEDWVDGLVRRRYLGL